MDVNLIKEIFSSEEVNAILSIPFSTTNQPNILMWRGTSNGSFTVGSAYHLAKELESREQDEPSMRGHKSIIWRGI
jgi:hypothetical protein